MICFWESKARVLKTIFNYFCARGHDFIFRLQNKGLDSWGVYTEQGELKLTKNDRLKNSLRLSDVERISAINKDQFTYDEIFLIFTACGEHLWVSQFSAGFDKISVEIARLFLIQNMDWVSVLNSVEPFEERVILLWERKAQSSDPI